MKIIKPLVMLPIIAGLPLSALSNQFGLQAPTTNYVNPNPTTNSSPWINTTPAYTHTNALVWDAADKSYIASCDYNAHVFEFNASAVTNASVREAAVKSYVAFYDYNAHSYEFNVRTFEWQYYSTKVIFWTVLFIVLTGIVFSGVQFYMAFSLKNKKTKKGKSDDVEKEREELQEIEASFKGIRVRSQYLGVVILAMSIIFFYLYLSYVYPITAVGSKPPQQTPATAMMQTPK